MYPAMAALKSKLVDEHEQGKMQGVLNTVNNVASSAGPVLYAPLWQFFDSSNQWSQWSTITIQWASVLIFPMMVAIVFLPARLRANGYAVGHVAQSDLTRPLASAAEQRLA